MCAHKISERRPHVVAPRLLCVRHKSRDQVKTEPTQSDQAYEGPENTAPVKPEEPQQRSPDDRGLGPEPADKREHRRAGADQ